MNFNMLSAALLIGLSSNVMAQTQAQKDDAKWIYERITGVKWAADHPLIVQAATMVAAGQRAEVAALATQQSQFLNVTVKNFALEMSTRDETIRIPLNDFAATIMGVVRDNTDARELLYGNFFYVGDPARIPAAIPNVIANANEMGARVLRSNEHFEALDSKNNRIDVGSVLMRVNGQRLVQNEANNVFTIVANPDPAGVLTSRTFIEAHAVAGTNRRPVEYTFRQFMCLPLEQWADALSSDVRIGRDIDRFPGGDHMKFQTSCKSCHTVMDGFRGAWARWDFDNNVALQTTVRQGASDGNRVLNKLNRNATVYPGGYVTTNDSWVNHAVRGVNATQFGWRGLDKVTPANSGTGVNQFGRLIANSQRFSTCMAKRVFKSVCRKELSDSELGVYSSLGTQFESMNYNLRSLYQVAALHPRCK
jgi:hypothetical protein